MLRAEIQTVLGTRFNARTTVDAAQPIDNPLLLSPQDTQGGRWAFLRADGAVNTVLLLK